MVRLVLLALALVPAFAFAGQLRGRVVMELPKSRWRAQIRLEPNAVAAVTDSAGRFVIHDLSPGAYALKAIIIGYLPLCENIFKPHCLPK